MVLYPVGQPLEPKPSGVRPLLIGNVLWLAMRIGTVCQVHRDEQQ